MSPVQVLVMLSTGVFCPPIMAAASDQAPAPDAKPKHVYAFRADSGNAQGDVVVQLKDQDGNELPGDAQVFITSDDDNSPPQGVKIKKIIGGVNLEPGGPWIGVQFSPVTKALAAQLKVKDQAGQMVGNVMEGSPADVAGFQQFDIITGVDGQEVSNDIGAFLEKVRAFKPGESHGFTLIRGGQTVTANVVIGERPAMDAMPKLKYPSETEELTGGHVFGRSGMLQKDPSGNWMFKGFNSKDLPSFWQSIPDVDDADLSFNFAVPGQGGNQVYVSKANGKTIRIEKDNSGKITVTRTEGKDGDKSTTTTTYNSEGEVQAADPDAYKMLQEGPQMHLFGADKLGHLPQIHLDIQDAMKNSEEAMKRLEERMQQLQQQGGASATAPQTFFMKKLRPKTNFETSPDGSIKVTTRDGEDELVQTYSNAEALRQAKPELYEKYQRLQDQQ